MIVHEDIVQRSPEWRAIRLGRLTGSCAVDMMASIKAGEAAARRNLRVRLVLERLTGQSHEDGYESADMRRGAEVEDEARVAYEVATGRLVRTIGFVSHDSLMAGCSPDGLIVGGGLLELKCPKSATHLGYLRTGDVPRDYFYQCLHGLWVAEQPWADFVSYDPRFPEALRLKITRITTEGITAYELAARMFLAEVDRELQDVTSLIGDKETAQV